MAVYRIDLNSDLGESFGAYSIGQDEHVIPLITSANVACGFHGGDPVVMRRTVDRCLQHGVGIGAHPSYPDLAGFGRRLLHASEEEVYGDVLYQIGALSAFARARGAALSHVKPHGAMNNHSFRDAVTARGIVRAVYDYDPALPLFAMPYSALKAEAERHGLPVINEVFADRAYNADGSLVDRKRPGAMVHDAALAADRAIRMVKEGVVETIDGQVIAMQADSVCVHGDNPAAVALVQALRQRLTEAGIAIGRPAAGQ